VEVIRAQCSSGLRFVTWLGDVSLGRLGGLVHAALSDLLNLMLGL